MLDAGELEGVLTFAANLRSRRFARPSSIAPDLWLGVTSRLTIGIIHRAASLDEIDAERPLCLRGCEVRYAGGIDVRYGFAREALAIAPRVRLLLRDVDPAKPAVTLGALARWNPGRFAISTDPYLRVGIANTDRGNRAALVVPVRFAIQPTSRWMLGVHVGFDSALAAMPDGWRGPVGIVSAVHPLEALEVSIELGFRSLVGPQHEYRERTLMITAGWHQHVL